MIPIDEIIKQLMWNKELDPFNEAYSLKSLSSFTGSLKDGDTVEIKNFGTLIGTMYINELYRLIKEDSQEVIYKAGISYAEAQKFLISSANRNGVISLYKFNEYIKKTYTKESGINFEDMIKYKVLSSGVEVELKSINDQSIEVINQAQKILSKCAYNPKEFTGEGYLFAYYFRLFQNGNLQYIVKNIYEAAVWEGGYLEVDEKQGSITLKFHDSQLLYVRRIGDFRLQRATAGQSAFVMSNILLRSLLYTRYYSVRQRRSIQISQVINGEIVITILDEEVENGFIYYLEYVSAMTSFYPFLQSNAIELSNLLGLKLDDVHIILSEITYILSKAIAITAEKYADVEPIESDLNKYAFRIKENIFQDSLVQTTTYTYEQLNAFLEFFTFDEKRNDYWRTPIIRQDGYYIFTSEPLIAQNAIYLTDYLLSKGEVSLDQRGAKLESYIKEKLKNIFMRKGYYYLIPDRKTFKLSKKKSEEIDLIVNTLHTVIIAEIKCISSPVDARSTYSAYKQLKKGVDQVKRKTQFIVNNQSSFINEIGNISGKDVFSIVITNLPYFTGLIEEGVPIIDIVAVNNYFSMGSLENRVAEETITYYNNEDEFSKNIRKYITAPAVVWSLKKYFHQYVKRISPEGHSPIYYAEVVEAIGDLIE